MCNHCGDEFFVLHGTSGDLVRCKHCNPPLLEYGFAFNPDEWDTESEKVEILGSMIAQSFQNVVRLCDRDQLKYMR